MSRYDALKKDENKPRRNEEHEERSETPFVFFVSSWFIFRRSRIVYSFKRFDKIRRSDRRRIAASLRSIQGKSAATGIRGKLARSPASLRLCSPGPRNIPEDGAAPGNKSPSLRRAASENPSDH